MLYMIVESFRNGNAEPVYRRFREQGRLAPEGLEYVTSWVTDDYRRCPPRCFSPDSHSSRGVCGFSRQRGRGRSHPGIRRSAL